MALAALSGDEKRIIFSQLCNVLEPRIAVAFGSASSELQELTQAPRQQLKADHEAAAALGRKARKWSCKELREAKETIWERNALSADLALLGTLESVLPALERLRLLSPVGVQRLAVKLGAGALPAMTNVSLTGTPVGDAGASALAVALGRGALPRLKELHLSYTGDTGLVALAPALRRLPALEYLALRINPFGDEGIAALVAPPPRRRPECWRGSRRSTSMAPRSPTPAAPPSPPRSTAARCRRWRFTCLASLPAPRRRPPCGGLAWHSAVLLICGCGKSHERQARAARSARVATRLWYTRGGQFYVHLSWREARRRGVRRAHGARGPRLGPLAARRAGRGGGRGGSGGAGDGAGPPGATPTARPRADRRGERRASEPFSEMYRKKRRKSACLTIQKPPCSMLQKLTRHQSELNRVHNTIAYTPVVEQPQRSISSAHDQPDPRAAEQRLEEVDPEGRHEPADGERAAAETAGEQARAQDDEGDRTDGEAGAQLEVAEEEEEEGRVERMPRVSAGVLE